MKDFVYVCDQCGKHLIGSKKLSEADWFILEGITINRANHENYDETDELYKESDRFFCSLTCLILFLIGKLEKFDKTGLSDIFNKKNNSGGK